MSRTQEEQIRRLAGFSVRLAASAAGGCGRGFPSCSSQTNVSVHLYAPPVAVDGGKSCAASSLIVVATDRRLLLAPWGVFTASSLLERAAQPPVESVQYTDVHSVEKHLGRLESKLTLLTASGTVRLTSMRANWASPVAAVVQERLTNCSGTEVS